MYGQRSGSNPFDNFGGGQQSSFQDTVQRPPLTYDVLNLSKEDDSQNRLDTSLVYLQRMEPYYRTDFPSLNLGSEISLGHDQQFSLDPTPLSFGQHPYRMLFDKTRKDNLINSRVFS